jgi:hypothetical protein
MKSSKSAWVLPNDSWEGPPFPVQARMLRLRLEPASPQDGLPRGALRLAGRCALRAPPCVVLGRQDGNEGGVERLILWGSSTLTSTLLEHGLADEVLRCVYPVLLGTEKRFFAEGTPPCSFELVSTKAMPSGIILNTYKVTGPLKKG